MSNWQQKTLVDHFKLIKGKKPKKLIKLGSIPYLTASIFRDGTSDFVEKSEVSKCVAVDNTDVLIIADGSRSGEVFRGKSGVLSSTMIVFKNLDKKYSSDFLYFFLLSKFKLLNKRTTGSTIPHVNKNLLKSLIIPNYDIKSQEVISYTLSTLQNKVKLVDKQIKFYEELKKSTMEKLFSEGLHGEKQKETEVGLIPKSWNLVDLDSTIDVKGGKRLPKGEKLSISKTDYPYIRVSDFKNYSVEISSLQFISKRQHNQIKRYIIEDDDVYISIAGSIGFVGQIPASLNGSNLTENAAKLIVRDKNTIKSRFLMYWLDTASIQNYIKSLTVKNAQPKLSLSRIKQIPVVIPETKEQEKMTSQIDSMINKVNILKEKKKSYQQLFNSMLHKLMNQEIEVDKISL